VGDNQHEAAGVTVAEIGFYLIGLTETSVFLA
jgi:hypothetical protein